MKNCAAPSKIVCWKKLCEYFCRNQRRSNESFSEHFWLSSNGRIYAITEKAALTIKRLRLNRSPLINNRQRKMAKIAETEFIEHLRNAAKLLKQTNREQANLLEEQQKLLLEQQNLLNILLTIEK